MGIVIGIVVTVIGLLLHIFYEQWKQKQNRQKEGLRKHFEDLADKIIRPLIVELGRYVNECGEFHIRQSGPLLPGTPIFATPSLDTSGFESSNLYSSFKLHFPNEAKRWDELKNAVCDHNITCTSFTERLREHVGKIGKLRFTPPAASGCHIDERVPTQLRKILYQLTGQQEYPNADLLYDFTKAIVQTEDGKEQVKLVFEEYKAREPLVIASGWDEAERYQACFKKLQQSPELREEALQLYNSAKELDREKGDFIKHLNSICGQDIKYGAELERQRRCLICQVIFGKQ